MVKFLDPVLRVAPPLHVQCISNEPLNVRLAAIREAIALGEEVNELGGWKNPGIGRPLHYAIDDSAQHDYTQLKQNLPVIKLLLEAGADPRLPCLRPGRMSPIEELEAWFRHYEEGGHSKWATEDLELYRFYAAALQIMKKAGLALDCRDKLHGTGIERNADSMVVTVQDTASTAQALNAPNSSGSWFKRLKPW